MKYGSYEWWKNKHEQDEARLKELEEKGIGAFSKYDVQIAYAGQTEQEMIENVKQLTRNHIAYEKARISELEAEGVQEKLF